MLRYSETPVLHPNPSSLSGRKKGLVFVLREFRFRGDRDPFRGSLCDCLRLLSFSPDYPHGKVERGGRGRPEVRSPCQSVLFERPGSWPWGHRVGRTFPGEPCKDEGGTLGSGTWEPKSRELDVRDVKVALLK